MVLFPPTPISHPTNLFTQSHCGYIFNTNHCLHFTDKEPLYLQATRQILHALKLTFNTTN